MDVLGIAREARRAAALGCVVALALVLDARTLAALGPEAWGGVLFLGGIGASTLSWRVRRAGPGLARAPALAASAALGVALGALAHDAPLAPLLVVGALGAVAWQSRGASSLQLATACLFLLAIAIGWLAQPWSAGGRLVQASAGLGLGASVALLVQRGPPARWGAAFAGVAAGALGGGWASL